MSFIISQNRNIPAICASIERLCALAGERHTDSRGGAFFAFPSPEALAALTEEELKVCRLGYRCKYVHAAAEAVRSCRSTCRHWLRRTAGTRGVRSQRCTVWG